MYNGEKIKLNVSGALKIMNNNYRRNYTTKDIAERVGVSRETLSRLTTSSPFSEVYLIAREIYEIYAPDTMEDFNLQKYIELMQYFNNDFILWQKPPKGGF